MSVARDAESLAGGGPKCSTRAEAVPWSWQFALSRYGRSRGRFWRLDRHAAAYVEDTFSHAGPREAPLTRNSAGKRSDRDIQNRAKAILPDEHCARHHQAKKNPLISQGVLMIPTGRSERIRTSGPCVPNTVLYQAELRSVTRVPAAEAAI